MLVQASTAYLNEGLKGVGKDHNQRLLQALPVCSATARPDSVDFRTVHHATTDPECHLYLLFTGVLSLHCDRRRFRLVRQSRRGGEWLQEDGL